jgi:EAL domain-containing protein (putative c-di-GMP-specific phosphodiesterase class I)
LFRGIAPSRVHFEITESEMMRDQNAAIEAITILRTLGAKIDLDNLGTGFSSLACLHHLPIDVVKLAKNAINITSTSARNCRSNLETPFRISRPLES